MKRVLLLLIVLSASATAAEVRWTHLSSETFDLPVPLVKPEPTASLVADLDKDGDADILVGARRGIPSLVWYRLEGKRWNRYVIDNELNRIEAGGAYHDIDGDGDLDVVFGADAGDNRIWWWENPYPDYAPDKNWTRRVIKNDAGNKHHDQIFGDFDGDGTAEFVSWNQRSKALLFFEIPDVPKATEPWPYEVIYSWSEGQEHEGLAAADINLDGKLDIIGGGRWFEHQEGAKFKPHVVDDTYRFSRALAGQFNKGGRPEVIFGPGDNDLRLKIYEWSGDSWTAREILPYDIHHGHSLCMADVDRDGNLDVFTAEMGQFTKRIDNPNARMYLFYGDGKGGFRTQIVQQGQGSHEARLGDLDGDGDLDIFGKAYRHNYPRIDIWRNDGPSKGRLALNKWKRHVIDPDRPERAVWMQAADLDGDGLKDIAAGAWWYKNPGKPSGKWVRNEIGDPVKNMSAVYDFDLDGDYDVLGRPAPGSKASADYCLAVNDGSGKFTIRDNPGKARGDFEQGIQVAWLEKEHEYQVALSWHKADNGIQLLTPPGDPATGKWSMKKISSFSQDEALSAGDVDRDGDRDLLMGTRWLRNDGDGNWSVQMINPVDGDPDRNALVDMNADGRLDSVVGFEAINKPGRLAWYEQPESLSDEWREHEIGMPVGPMAMSVADMDGDGDPDVVVGEHNYEKPATAKLIVFENLDGKSAQRRQNVVHTGDEHHDGALAVDIDGDGDMDIISIGWSHANVLVYENRAIP